MESLLGDFVNPQKRIFLGYLLVTLFLAFTVFVIKYGRRLSLKRIATLLFSKEYWFSSSSQADVKIYLFNRLILGGLTRQFVTKSTVGLGVYFYLLETQWVLDISPWLQGLVDSVVLQSMLFTFVLFAVDDYSRFWVHRAMHRFPLLWQFHKVHHSATRLTPMTVFRTHPVEALLFGLRGVFVQGAVIGGAFALFGTHLSLATVLGANVLSVLFHFAGSNLRHSHIPLRFPSWLEAWLMSPAQHQLHHSIDVKHYDSNFGVAFSVWDRWHGSFKFSEKRRMRVGLSDQGGDAQHHLHRLILDPFRYLVGSKKPILSFKVLCQTKEKPRSS